MTATAKPSRRLKRKLLLIPLALILIQFIPVQCSVPPVNGRPQIPPDVEPLLMSACWDCHSSETVWPAYSRIAPASWLMQWHVDHGREYLNFTNWDALSPEEIQIASAQIIHVIERGEMPLASYVWMHPDAKLTPAQKERLIAWAKTLRASR